MTQHTIKSPIPGEVLQGRCHVIAETSEQSVPFRALSLWIDGHETVSGVLRPLLSAEAELETPPVREMLFPINTFLYANGSHTLEIRDCRNSRSEHVAVRFENVISSVSYDPIFELSADATEAGSYSRICASVSPAQEWAAEIQDSHGGSVKRYRGHGAQIDVSWFGHNDAGELADADQYELVIKAIDSEYTLTAGGIIKARA